MTELNDGTEEDDDLSEAFKNGDLYEIYRAVISKWGSVILEALDDDRPKLEKVEDFESVFIRAKWEKFIELMFHAGFVERRYQTDRAKLDLVTQMLGENLELDGSDLAPDVGQRLEWYKARIASEYERRVKSTVSVFEIKSPIEQIFLMEWAYLNCDAKLNVRMEPQVQIETCDGPHRVDFLVERDGDEAPKIVVEIDGHEFHEKTKEQAAHDRMRERAITKEGYTILRFTGSEVFRNPRKCVNEVIDCVRARSVAKG